MCKRRMGEVRRSQFEPAQSLLGLVSPMKPTMVTCSATLPAMANRPLLWTGQGTEQEGAELRV